MSELKEQVMATQEALRAIQESLKQLQIAPGADDASGADEEDGLEKWARRFVDFTYKNPTTHHVVAHYAGRLEAAGFRRLDERDEWELPAEGRFFTVRNGTSLAAFVVGRDWKATDGVGVIATHCDALAAKVRPVSARPAVDGYELLGVAPYAGALSPVWLDRDLGIGGRVLVREADSDRVRSRLVDSTPHPVARISTLAPHFGAVATGPLDPETQMVPVIGYGGADAEASAAERAAPLFGKHPLPLLRYVARLAGVEVAQLVQLDLDLFDVQRGSLGGLRNDFLFAPRLDDRLCSFAAMEALLAAPAPAPAAFDAVVFFDNEEIGSRTRQGAAGGLLGAIAARVLRARGADPAALPTLFANSVVLSADVTHLLNPSFCDQYLDGHKPVPNAGLALALDENGHMATDSVGTAFAHDLAAAAGAPLQYFHIRNGARSGGTVGPILSAATGARTIDLGIPQLSMHSIRAAAGSRDLGLAIRFFAGFLADWRAVYDRFRGL
ncbi:ABL035Cp [Eremothecium gossypii ATCC 10895]|uniref:ABL035Cp n=1 Tax=Eremothecium gossypii (strain ATCC 10895 / CBS 109.51 / FGSC 9923 / NRRL Y-1056) TaxID=284811 RepID=Q75DQ2_EREGS|nr:ABL035Cp [Eremothecium gossypii ATCC 10895]AAS50736.2 ABL035Cp [Eremothecium gossypii ATCC 10895]